MFGPATFTVLALLLAVSVLARYAPLFLLALTLLLAAGLSKLWERYCLSGLEYRRHLSHGQSAFGDTVVLELEIVNRKLLPLAWLEIADEIPGALPPARGRVRASHQPGRALLVSLIALRPYERVRRRYELPARVRGEHLFGPVRLRSGDLFGLVRREVVLEQVDTLVVCPRVVPPGRLGLPARQPLGNLGARTWLFEDPSRLAGARDYRPGDGLRRIHWAASARAQRLQARVYEPTTGHKLMIFLNLTSVTGPHWRVTYAPDVVELAIMAAASIAAWGQANAFEVGLASNGLHRLEASPGVAASSAAPTQHARLRQSLGRLQPISTWPFERVLAEESRRLTFGTSAVVISALVTSRLITALAAMRRRGHTVTLVLVGREAPNVSLPGIAVRRVGPPEAWRDLATLAPRP